jgi:hypothetical protein
MVMGFLDIFSKERRETLKSKWEYNDCYRARQGKLLSFRKHAIKEIMFRYPDARLLLNRLDRRFMVLLKSSGVLLVGKFADDYYPPLDYVGDMASTSERREAVARFRSELGNCTGNICKEEMPRFLNVSRWLSQTIVESFKTKGFAVTGSAELENLVGGSLFLNGTRIAMASIWDPKPKGYFTAKILEELTHNAHCRPETQSLIFVTIDSYGGSGGQKMVYQIMFDRSIHLFDATNKNEFTDAIISLRDFVYDIEDYFRPGVNKLDWEDPDYVAVLESPDRDEDESIESRYLL